MSVTGTTPPHLPPQGRDPQQTTDLGSGLNTGGRGTQQGAARDSNPRQEERFGRSLQKALALQLNAPKDGPEDQPVGGLATSIPLPFLTPTPSPTPEAQTTRAAVDSIAERIDRYIRGAESGQVLRQGEGMVVKLPPNILGVTEVSVKLRGDVLLVSIGLQAQAAAATGLHSQIALLGQALSLRQPRHQIRVETTEEDDGTIRSDVPRDFNPLFPKGRIG